MDLAHLLPNPNDTPETGDTVMVRALDAWTPEQQISRMLELCEAQMESALSESDVLARFGRYGSKLQRLARGLEEEALSFAGAPRRFCAERSCDPPLERLDEAAFVMRALAADLDRGHAARPGLARRRPPVHRRDPASLATGSMDPSRGAKASPSPAGLAARDGISFDSP